MRRPDIWKEVCGDRLVSTQHGKAGQEKYIALLYRLCIFYFFIKRQQVFQADKCHFLRGCMLDQRMFAPEAGVEAEVTKVLALCA